MAGSLMPCGACNRHVRSGERSCPFCGVTLALSEPIAELRLLTRLDRSRLVALGALLSGAGMALGCHEQKVVAVYGAPPSPVGTSSSAPPTVPPPAGSGSALVPNAQSAPAPTSQPTAAPTTPRAPIGAPVAVYGAAPPLPEPGSELPQR